MRVHVCACVRVKVLTFCVLLAAVTEVNGVDKNVKEPVVLLSGHEKEVFVCSWNPVSNLLVSG